MLRKMCLGSSNSFARAFIDVPRLMMSDKDSLALFCKPSHVLFNPGDAQYDV